MLASAWVLGGCAGDDTQGGTREPGDGSVQASSDAGTAPSLSDAGTSEPPPAPADAGAPPVQPADPYPVACLGPLLKVPGDYATIAAAITAAKAGDTVLVAPGTYPGFTLAKDDVTVSSRYCQSRDPEDTARTLISGDILVTAPSSAKSRLIGFTIKGVDRPVAVDNGGLQILYNRISGGGDMISSGDDGRAHIVVIGNYIEGAGDDSIDMDGASSAVIERNTFANSGQDGIETRLYAYTGPKLEIVVRDNLFLGAGQDGIQLISGYQVNSPRSYRIERNVFKVTRAGVGLLDNAVTDQDYRGASLQEEILVLNNTFVGCNHGISGGDNLLAANNLFVGSTRAIWRVDAQSSVKNNLFFMNATDHAESNVDAASNLIGKSPLLGADYALAAGSPAINAGAAVVSWGSKSIAVSPGFQKGAAPDLGAKERE